MLIHNLSTLRKLLNNQGATHVRWSRGPKYDLKPDAVSKDYITGAMHNGLSAVPLHKDYDDDDLVDAIKEYGFHRVGIKETLPHIYSGEIVGKDSDSYDSILPKKYLGTFSKNFIKEMDSGLPEFLDKRKKIKTLNDRYNSVTDPIAKKMYEQNIIDMGVDPKNIKPTLDYYNKEAKKFKSLE